jgi:hypothetical protein
MTFSSESIIVFMSKQITHSDKRANIINNIFYAVLEKKFMSDMRML